MCLRDCVEVSQGPYCIQQFGGATGTGKMS
jgi:hypothetical protein